MAVTHWDTMYSTRQLLDKHPAQAKELKAERARRRRAEKLAIKNRVKPENPFLNNPQPDWVAAGGTLHFGLPPKPRRSKWQPAPKEDDHESPIAQLKRTLAGNFKRVVHLFKHWDVNCDGAVDVHELYNAIGHLRLSDDDRANWNMETCKALFDSLDRDGSGSIEMHELHHALRKYDPPPLEDAPAPDAAPPTDSIAARRPYKPRAIDNEAVHNIKRLLAAHQSRVIDLFRKWDYDMDASVTPFELRRALGALSIPIEPKALKLLFKQIDTDASGAISFSEVSARGAHAHDKSSTRMMHAIPHPPFSLSSF